MHAIVLAIHIVVSLALIGLVLLQHGRGADVGAAFGAGASGSVFGSRGPATFLSRTTAVLAAVFFFTSVSLAWMSREAVEREGGSVVERLAPAPGQTPAQEQDAPAQPTDLPEIPGSAPEGSDVPEVPQNGGG